MGQTHHSTNLLLHPILALTTHQEWGEYIIPCLIFSSLSKIDFCFLKLSCNLNQKKVKKTIHFCKGLKSNGCTCINTILSCLSPKNKCFNYILIGECIIFVTDMIMVQGMLHTPLVFKESRKMTTQWLWKPFTRHLTRLLSKCIFSY